MLRNGSAGFWQLVEVRVRRDEGKQPAEGKEGSGEGTGLYTNEYRKRGKSGREAGCQPGGQAAATGKYQIVPLKRIVYAGGTDMRGKDGRF